MSCNDEKNIIGGGLEGPSGTPADFTADDGKHCYKCGMHLTKGLCPQCDYCEKCGAQKDSLGLCPKCDPGKAPSASKAGGGSDWWKNSTYGSYGGYGGGYGGYGGGGGFGGGSFTSYAATPDADLIEDSVGVGASPTTLSFLKKLKEDGYTAILNVQEVHEFYPSKEAADYTAENFAWASIPAIDSFVGGIPPLSWIDACTRQMEQWDKEGERIYVHCKMGKGRSPLIVLAHLVVNKGMNFGVAMAQMRKKRDAADPNIHQLKKLLEYIKLRQMGLPIPDDGDPKVKPFTLEKASSSSSSYKPSSFKGSAYTAPAKKGENKEPKKPSTPAARPTTNQQPAYDADEFCELCGKRLNARGLCPNCDTIWTGYV